MFNLRPIGDSLPEITKKALGKKGLLFGKLAMNWTAIVGEEIAARAKPKEIRMTRTKLGKPNQARLHLAVNSSADAFELSYEVAQLIQRINGFFGYEAVHDIKLIHAPKNKHPEQLKKRVENLKKKGDET